MRQAANLFNLLRMKTNNYVFKMVDETRHTHTNSENCHYDVVVERSVLYSKCKMCLKSKEAPKEPISMAMLSDQNVCMKTEKQKCRVMRHEK